MSGGGGTTSTSSNAPPQQFLDAYQNVLGQAQGVAATPYQQYNGQLQAGFSPLQNAGFNTIASAPGVSSPYINAAAQDFTNANAPLQPQMQPYVNAAQGQFQQAAGANLQGALSPYQTQAQRGFSAGSQAIDPTQYSAQAIQGFQSPYTQQVVDATQAQFNNQNQQAATALQGNAASRGALGGDRLGVAQAQLAGQQQLAQAPVIAGLENTGFNQAQQEFNQQQQTNLGAQQNTASRQLQGAQGLSGLGQQSLTAAQQQAAIQQQAGTGFAGLGQQELGAAQGQGWLSAQSGAGMAGLGNQALSSTIASGNALLGAGAQQQAQAQQSLNIPYQQFLAQQAYPFQTTGWLSNIAQGLGSGAGGSGSSTVPGPSALSQVGGLGVAGVGLAGQLGAFGGGTSASDALAAGTTSGISPAVDSALANAAAAGNRGGQVGGGAIGFAGGGSVPGAEDVTIDGGGVPDAGTTIVPEGATGGAPLIKRNYGSTTTGSGADNTLQTVAQVAALAAMFANRGGAVHGFAAGGIVPDDGSATPGMADVTQGGSPEQRPSWVPGSNQPPRRGPGPPKAPVGARPENIGDEATKWVSDARTAFGKQNTNSNYSGFAQGGSVPILPRGFAAGGSPAISVTSVPNARGVGVPTMTVDPSVTSGASGSASSQLADYLKTTQAGAHQTPPTPVAVKPTPPDPNALTASQSAMLQQFLAGRQQQFLDNQVPHSGNGTESMRRGGIVQGFADGGGTDDPLNFDPSRYLPPDAPDAGVYGPTPAFGDGPTTQRAARDVVPPAPSRPPVSTPVLADKSNPPLGGLSPDDDATPQDRGPPPPPQRDPMAGFYADALSKNRALKEDHANPWLALATAGFGMMAGQSSHPLTNVGTGGLAGMNQFVSADRSAKELAARVDESRARLAESQAYHEATNQTRNYGIDTRHQDRQDQLASQQAIAFARMAAAAEKTANAGQAGKYSFVGLDADGNSIMLDGKTGETITGPKIGMKAGEAARVDQGNRRLDQGDQRLEETAAWHNKEAELRDQGFTESARRNILSNAANLVRADITGKMRFSDAVDQVRKQAGVLGGTKGGADPITLPPAQIDTAPVPADPLGIR